MASALVSLANATATFEVAGTGVTTDPATGNVVPVPNTVTVSLFLKADPRESRRFPGVDLYETVYQGYAVEPMILDSQIKAGTRGTLAFGGADAVDCEVIAARAPYGNQGVLGSVLSAALGDSIVIRAADQG